jgi:hypothetical protein
MEMYRYSINLYLTLYVAMHPDAPYFSILLSNARQFFSSSGECCQYRYTIFHFEIHKLF